MISFTMKIEGYKEDTQSFQVLYTPDDPDCTPIGHFFHIDVAGKTQDEILEILKASAPIFMWEQQKRSAAMDHTPFKDLIGTDHPVTNTELQNVMNARFPTPEVPLLAAQMAERNQLGNINAPIEMPKVVI